MRKALVAAIVVVGLLAGCASDGGPGMEGSPLWKMRVSDEMVKAYDVKVENKEAFFREVMVNGEVIYSHENEWEGQKHTVKFKGILYKCYTGTKLCQEI